MKGIAPLAAQFDRTIRAGKIPPMIVVFPNGMESSMWCDSKDWSVPMETVVVRELLPHVDVTLRTLAGREGRAIEGFSMGGYGAARLGFSYPELFGAVSILGGGPLQQQFDIYNAPRGDPREAQALLQNVYGGDQAYFRAQSPWELAAQHAGALSAGTRIRIAIGERDELLENNRKFDARLSELGIPHRFTVLRGVAHEPAALLDALGENNWTFYREAFGAVVPGRSDGDMLLVR